MVLGVSVSLSQNADEQNLTSVKLQRSVITASGYDQEIKDAPASISVVDKEEILTRPIRDIGDAVQDVPGVYIETSRNGANAISMRGLEYTYTLFLIDGKRQNVTPGFNRGFAELLNTMMPPTSMIERIEVIRGPASIIYGSDAMGGVINVITKKYVDKYTASVQFDTRLAEDSKFGNMYGANAYLALPLIKNTLSINLRGSYRYGDKAAYLKPAGLNDTSSNPYSVQAPTAFSQWNAGGRISYLPNAHNSFYFDTEAYFARGGTLNSSNNTVVRDFYKFNNVLNYDANYDWGNINTYVQYSKTMLARHLGEGGSAGVVTGANKGAYVDWAHPWINTDIIFQSTYNKNFDLDNYGVIGFNGGVYFIHQNYYTISSRTNAVTDTSLNQVAIFGEGQYHINEYISTTLGLRYNYSDIFRAIPNPRFFVNINPTEWLTLKAGISSGVITPPIYYLDNEFYTQSSGMRRYGNEALKQETSWNYEFSAIVENDYLSMIATGYYTDFNNKIAEVGFRDPNITYCANANRCFMYQNVDRAITTGAELAFKLEPINGFSLNSTYAFTYTEQKSGTYKGQPLNAIPKHSFTIKPEYRYGNFSSYIRWQGRFQTPTLISDDDSVARNYIGTYYKNYQLVDFALSYKFTKNLNTTLAVNNIFNTNFMDYVLYNNATEYINAYQKVLAGRNYWLTFRVDI
ncbi:ferric enterobactin uptake receptor [Helicobacter sp. MIT 00-7814]|nr:ferric enterobactin uptake receptor [Helicobacter sp. MIT 00-7814]RDU54693.1 ferric enterobactin uptake receptor [Helicobacter sp. MIT 99-10781]